jgi:hypothetical protein
VTSIVSRRAGLPSRLEDLIELPMVDKHLQGPTRGHHRFTVASMVSRRVGRTFSDLACDTGACRICCGAGIRRGLPGDAAAAGYGDAGFIPCLIQPGQPGMMRPGTAGLRGRSGFCGRSGQSGGTKVSAEAGSDRKIGDLSWARGSGPGPVVASGLVRAV